MVKMNKDLCERLGGKWDIKTYLYGLNACVGIDLSGANIPEADLTNANLQQAKINSKVIKSLFGLTWSIYKGRGDVDYEMV